MTKIRSIKAHKIVDSRGAWTVDTHIELENGLEVEHPIPNGASKGENEAVYVPIDQAVAVVNDAINDALVGEDITNQTKIDSIMLEMDGSANKSNLGGNSILSVSLACAKAAALVKKVELFEYVSDLHGKNVPMTSALKFPTPIFNVLNGGKHAQNNLSFQEFMVIPAPGIPFLKQMEMGVNIYIKIRDNLHKEGINTGVGDEGGFSPSNFTTKMALLHIRDAVAEMYKLGENVFLGMDVAAESFVEHEEYKISEEDLLLDVTEFTDYYRDLISNFPLIYVEDPFYEKDFDGWEKFYNEFNTKLMVVADDLAVTNVKFLQRAIDKKLANAVIVKPNQVGTLTETLEFIKLAQKNNMQIVVSHRSGDTAEDTFIADLALGVGAQFIKSGSPARGERVAKYNRLLDIYSKLGLS